ncbi:11395_t:CDS:2 [Acaulospora colombiana]|uniref:11395_t:CDS:1 n=1 Tax=Acaulospora colombiana TaxID=27376 RepID=A0ACA9KNV3_9GLOM|nr:11395_t:CDS:2 [Acaulospora colombiana]
MPNDKGFNDGREARADRNERNRDKDSSDLPSSEVRGRQISDDGRISDRDRNSERPNREVSMVQQHKDDRRRGAYDRDPRERLRDERYNRITASEKDHRDHRSHDFDRERRERERQERYNKSVMEDKANSDVPRRLERDRTAPEHERPRGSHGSPTQTAETSSNSTARGGASRSSSTSDKEKMGARRSRSLERIKKDDQAKDRPHDSQRDREYDSRTTSNIPKDREQDLLRTRDSAKNREPRPHDEMSKDGETSSTRDKLDVGKNHERDSTNTRKVDEKEAAFRRLDERTLSTNRRPEDHRPASSTSDRSVREHPLRDREKDSHYQRGTSQRLRIDSLRRDERPSNIRPKDPLGDPAYQDIRDRDSDPRQKGVQSTITQSELDRAEKRKREEAEMSDRKPYYDRDQRGDDISSSQRPPDYRIRDRQQDEFPLKDAMRVGLVRDQERELTNRKDDRDRPLHERPSALPDLYRPSSDHHTREPDRRPPIRDFERDYRIRDMRGEIPGVDRYRVDYSRDNHQGRERLPDNIIDRRPSWELERGKDYHTPGTFIDKDLNDNRRERTRESEFESRGNSVEKADPHKQSYDRLQSDRRMSRNDVDQVNRTLKLESVRRVDNERIPPSVNEKSNDIQSKEGNSDLALPKGEDELPYPWKRCVSSKNKVYYFNTETRMSHWNYPNDDNGKKSTTDGVGNEDGKNTDCEPFHKDDNNDVDAPRKRLRPDEHKTERMIIPENRRDTNGERSIGPDEQSTLSNTSSSRDLPSRDSEPSIRRARSNTVNNVTTTPPQSSPPIRSPNSTFCDRRYSTDYELSGGSRRGGPYVGPPQLQSPSSSLRNPLGRAPPSEFYDHNDVFRHDDFRGPGGIMDMRMGGGMMMPQMTTNSRSGRFAPNHTFGIDQGSLPGARRMSSVGRGGPSSTHFPSQYRKGSSLEDERSAYAVEEVHMGFPNDVENEMGPNSSHRFSGDPHNSDEIGNRHAMSNERLHPTGSRHTGEFRMEKVESSNPAVAVMESDEEAWRTDDEMVDFGLADTEPQSLLLHHPVPYNPYSQPLPDDEIIRRQVAPVWNHITSSVAGDELFQQFEHIMNNNGNSRKRKREMRILNSRKEFEQRRVMYGGKRMYRYKHLFATPRHLPKTAYPDYFVYPKLATEISDELFQSCIEIYQCNNENTTQGNFGVAVNVEDHPENKLNRRQIEEDAENEAIEEISTTAEDNRVKEAIKFLTRFNLEKVVSEQAISSHFLPPSSSNSTLLTVKASPTDPAKYRTDRPILIVSSTSWTADEDFSMLLQAAQICDQFAVKCSEKNSKKFPKLLFAISGEGPLKAKYVEKISKMSMDHVRIVTTWLPAEDYPLLLGSADLGLCFHTSSSGMDLPMKIVDMFGCGLPVCAVGFEC